MATIAAPDAACSEEQVKDILQDCIGTCDTLTTMMKHKPYYQVADAMSAELTRLKTRLIEVTTP